MMSNGRPRIAFVVSSSMTVNTFLAPHLWNLSPDYDLTLFLDGAQAEVVLSIPDEVAVERVPLTRALAPLADLKGLWALYAAFSGKRFDMVISQTPKAGLLAALAGFAARIPVRAHLFTGQVWATRSGIARVLLKAADSLVARLATHTLADSPSQRQFLIANGVVDALHITVLASGSISGVDIERFGPNSVTRSHLREELGIPGQDRVILYLGRLTREKGIPELATAFAALAKDHPDTWLVLAGPDEGAMAGQVAQTCSHVADRLRFLGYTKEPEKLLAMADLLCLPSHREGFGSVVIEAAACGIPSVGTAIYGVCDAIEDNRTGLLVSPYDPVALQAALVRLTQNRQVCSDMGAKARARVMDEFRSDIVTDALRMFIQHALGQDAGAQVNSTSGGA